MTSHLSAVKEFLFYEMYARHNLETVLPILLERCLKRKWSVVIQSSSIEECDALDNYLWSYSEDSFLPHIVSYGKGCKDSPIILTADRDNMYQAVVRVLVNRAIPPDLQGYMRSVFIFDGSNSEELAQATSYWQIFSTSRHKMSYWKQDAYGCWIKKY